MCDHAVCTVLSCDPKSLSHLPNSSLVALNQLSTILKQMGVDVFQDYKNKWWNHNLLTSGINVSKHDISNKCHYEHLST